ncbi:hypothetical protein ATE84_1780 [Aquimarina sp. MAR_2010_214]|nr:hypothetical protein ATE84_1780 [Aquimarina sp. MAR_2010_214]
MALFFVWVYRSKLLNLLKIIHQLNMKKILISGEALLVLQPQGCFKTKDMKLS